MIDLVQILQVLSGMIWLMTAVYLTPRIIRSWIKSASRMTVLSAPVGFIAWLQVGFTIRWIAWPHSLAGMEVAELTTWASLYALSGLLAVWFLMGARQTRGE